MRFLDLTRWPTILIFLFAGAVGAGFALMTVNLFSQAMASMAFLRKFGLAAVEHGALWQVAELLAWGAASLVCWVAFKISENALVERYRAWVRRQRIKHRQKSAKARADAQAKDKPAA
jgi:hypothetical protein